MKKLFRFALCVVFCLIYTAFNLVAAAPLPTVECEVIDYKPDNRHYARAFAANLDIGEPRTVRMIYFLPNDRPYRADVVERIKDEIRNIQTFYAEQMQTHGYGYTTFRVETDAQDEPVVHRVEGQHPEIHYLEGNEHNVTNEVQQKFDTSQNIYFIVLDNRTDLVGLVAGRGGNRGKSGGTALVSDDFEWITVAHELGHAFGLQHDFNDRAYIMSYGGGQRNSLSVCSAEFLSVHPYFNPDISTESGQSPTIELISPNTYPTGSESVSIQLKVSDSNGLHQVILFVITIGIPFTPTGFPEVKACRRFAGEKESVIEFEYDGDIPSTVFTNLSNPAKHSIRVEATDVDGNVNYISFVLSEISDEPPPPSPKTLVKLSGDNQVGTPGAALPHPLIVEVREKQSENPLPGIQVKFTITLGEGKLNTRFTSENVTADAHGRAQSILTPGVGANTVEVFVSGGESITFHAMGIQSSTISRMDDDYRTWQLPDGAILRMGKGGGSEVAFSPDSSRFAVASAIGIWLYDAMTARELALLPTIWWVGSVDFSPDGRILASGLGVGTIKLWDVTTGMNIATLEGHHWRSGVHSVSFSPDGKILASAGGDNKIKLWDVATGKNIITIKHPYTTSMLFSPDGKIIASGSEDDTIKLWDAATGENITTLEGHKSYVYSVSFSPDGKTIASGSYDNTVKLWNVATGQNITTLRHKRQVVSVSFSPDGKTLASGAWDGTILLWDVTTRTDIARAC